jgi:hypothetical protein
MTINQTLIVLSNEALWELTLFGDRRVVRNPQRTLGDRFYGYSILQGLVAVRRIS